MEERPSCLIHCENDDGSLTNFTSTSFKRFLECRRQWLQLDGRQRDVALTTTRVIPIDEEESLECFNNFFYHQRCYSTFTNKTFISRAQRRSENTAETLTETPKSVEQKGPTPGKIRLRSKSTSLDQSVKSKSKHILPPTCIICKKECSYYTDPVCKL